jgi:two-component sensor histidine kinase
MTKEGEDSADVVNQATSDTSMEDGFGRGLLRALRNTDISVLYQDTTLRYLWAENVPRIWSEVSLVGRFDPEFLPQGEVERVIEAKRSVLDNGEQRRLEIRFPNDESACWYDLWIDADHSADGGVSGIITTAVEITDQKQREQTLRALLREVSHRSKNLLAIIQSIATQTGRYSDSIGDFLNRFRGRLQSLASSQDLVTSSNWRGADLQELIAGQVIRYCADPVHNLRIEGSNPYLNPNAALHIGLALHELAVNSVSHGALSTADGVVVISARPVSDNNGHSRLELMWSEHIDGDVKALAQKRFGSLALERVVPASMNGTASLVADERTLTYLLSIPADNFEME